MRGTTNVYSLAVKDKDTGDPYVLAEGEVLRFAVKRNENSTVKLIEKANEPGLAVVYFTENAEQIEEGFWEYDEYYLIKKSYPMLRHDIEENITRWFEDTKKADRSRIPVDEKIDELKGILLGLIASNEDAICEQDSEIAERLSAIEDDLCELDKR